MKQIKNANNGFYIKNLSPMVREKYGASGCAEGHYFHQDLLVARRIFNNNPNKHLDIGSRIDGFVAHVASFRTIEVLDIRPLESKSPGIIFKQADLMNDCSELYDSYESISSLHAVEHFGLGRYGDNIDIYGSEKGMDNLYKILKRNGKFYFSVPIGQQRIEFNAHKVFSVSYLMELFKDRYIIDSFSFVDDKGHLFENIKMTQENIASNFGCNYGCGIFELTKL